MVNLKSFVFLFCTLFLEIKNSLKKSSKSQFPRKSKIILRPKTLGSWMIIRWGNLQIDELHNSRNLRKGERRILSLIIMWKRNRKRVSNEGLKLIRPSYTISKVKPFNKGILKLQEDFNEALKDPQAYVLREKIKQLSWQLLGMKLEEDEI
jgi:hypothetical protein